MLENVGENYFKSVKLLENLTSFLKGIQISKTQQLTKTTRLKVHMTNICSEITLHTDENHSFVCCLSSLNLAKYDEWKNTNIIYDSIWFLDGVLEEFIQRAKYRKGFENSVRSAEKGRALGLGVLGWHTYYKKKVYHLRVYYHNMKLEEFLAKSKSNLKELLWLLQMLMENLFGVSVLAFVIPIYALLLPLLVIANFLEIFLPGLNPGRLMYLRNSQLKARSLGKILHWLKFWKR